MEMMANSLLRNLLYEIKESEWYAIIADETRDSSGKEQLTVSIRWVDKDYHVNEDLIGLIDVAKTDALSISEVIKDVLIRCTLQLTQCRGQTYDGASNMSVRLSGVAVRIKQLQPKAHYIHCMAHSLNLLTMSYH